MNNSREELNGLHSEYKPEKPKRGFMYNKNFIAVLSLLLSIALWVAVTLDVKQVSTNVFQDIIIDMQTADLSRFDLELIEIKGPASLTGRLVDVTASGSLYSLSQITRDDITVAAVPTGTISQPGIYRLSLSVSCSNRDVNVYFTGGETYLTARFDYRREKSFEIDNITTSGASVDTGAGLVIGEVYSSIKSITVSGAETEVSQISDIEIFADVNKALDATSDFSGVIIFRGEDGTALDASVTKYFRIVGYNDNEGEPTADEIVVTVPVNKVAELPVSVPFKKIPENFDISTLKYSVEPGKLSLEGHIDAMNSLIEAGEYTLSDGIDLSQLRPETGVQNLKLNLSSGLVELNGTESVVVKFDLTGYSTKALSLSNELCEFRVTNAGELDVQIIDPKIDNVIIIGPAASLERLTEAQCVVSVDMTTVDSASGQKLANATVYFKSVKDCWAIGIYQLKVLVK